ncbi:ATP-binding cassette domain-containing protein [Rhodococcus sp. NPDC127528]|uniref:ABC transporter ATP-binding protein n=1 Tax=unclassified Rhodococcus (in: high G+C Gram-positive bacteria) TaxID=192944 RepID=UPI00363399B0
MTTTTELRVVTNGLTKRYGERVAVDDVDITVRAGEVYGFLGPNGAGKTTTLRMLAGLVRPTSGSATVLGRHPGDPDASVHTGVLIEGPGFYPYLSGRDNLRVLCRYRGLADAAAEAALDRVGLRARAGDRFRGYSLGMKQRLGVAAALLGDPDLLILDEPTNGLDPAGVAEMRALIADLAAAGHTVLLSSHMLDEVQDICDRVGVIVAGRLAAESTVSDLRGGSSIVVRATPGEQVLAVARDVAGADRVSEAADGVRVDAGAALAPRLVRALVESGVEVFDVHSSERSLEDVFLEMTSSATTGDTAEVSR